MSMKCEVVGLMESNAVVGRSLACFSWMKIELHNAMLSMDEYDKQGEQLLLIH